MPVVSEGVVRASYLIVDVLAELRRVRCIGVTHLQTELSGTDEVDPLDHLGVRLVARQVARLDKVSEGRRGHAEAVRVHDSSERISLLVRTVRVKLVEWYSMVSIRFKIRVVMKRTSPPMSSAASPTLVWSI